MFDIGTHLLTIKLLLRHIQNGLKPAGVSDIYIDNKTFKTRILYYIENPFVQLR